VKHWDDPALVHWTLLDSISRDAEIVHHALLQNGYEPVAGQGRFV